MTVPVAFTKASGAGNDFILVNNFTGTLNVDFARLARASCDRHFGVGADGLLVIEKSARADFTMLYFNADGSYGGMCGNGGRCIARFALMEGIAGQNAALRGAGSHL
jgi:diaminopimelate epimerase